MSPALLRPMSEYLRDSDLESIAGRLSMMPPSKVEASAEEEIAKRLRKVPTMAQIGNLST